MSRARSWLLARRTRRWLAHTALTALAISATGCCALFGIGCPCEPDAAWGRFDGHPQLRGVGDGHEFQLLTPFTFVDRTGVAWTAARFDDGPWTWNGASIPRSVWSFIGSPFKGCHQYPSILHDYLYQRRGLGRFSREQVDRIYYESLRAAGAGAVNASVQHFALRAFGVRWEPSEPPAPPATLEEQRAVLGMVKQRLIDATVLGAEPPDIESLVDTYERPANVDSLLREVRRFDQAQRENLSSIEEWQRQERRLQQLPSPRQLRTPR
ncbi:MAG: DUF1353 domain-containing protein [Planctomycetes bacterium]|nr:DUF1353 domain-containing protein [Planctomycetota bacterium]